MVYFALKSSDTPLFSRMVKFLVFSFSCIVSSVNITYLIAYTQKKNKSPSESLYHPIKTPKIIAGQKSIT